VEAFLRGSDMRSQVLMARAGLLLHLVDGVLNAQGSGNLQVHVVSPLVLRPTQTPLTKLKGRGVNGLT
jgi:hypothetical protein